MNKRVLAITALSMMVFMPLVAFGQARDLNYAATNIQKLIQTATYIVYMLAFLAFFWGLAQFLFNAGNDEKRKKGIQIIIWSIVVIFVMTSIWGIVKILQGTLGASDNSVRDIQIPGIQYRNTY